jgi:putative flippase GtrA
MTTRNDIFSARASRATSRAGLAARIPAWSDRLLRTTNYTDSIRQFATFLAFGGIAAIVNLSTGWLLYGIRPFPYLPYWCATLAAAWMGLFVNFSLNYRFTFKFRDRSAFKQFITFSVVSSFGTLLTGCLSTGLLFLLEYLDKNELQIITLRIRPEFAAHFMAVALVVLYSFPAHRAISFNVGLISRVRGTGLLPLRQK